jgi:hypothetical protein
LAKYGDHRSRPGFVSHWSGTMSPTRTRASSGPLKKLGLGLWTRTRDHLIGYLVAVTVGVTGLGLLS